MQNMQNMQRLTITKRNDLPQLFSFLGFSTGLELGVGDGVFSFHILSNWAGVLNMVDCWKHQDLTVYKDDFNASDDVQERRYQGVLNTAKQFKGRAVIHRDFSKDAASKFPDGSLDFVYLDGNHQYEAISEDLILWYPKVRQGGFFGGHDYLDLSRPSGEYGVKRAVTEFAQNKGFTYQVTPEEWPTWYTII